jgi:hypothetical protein
MTGNRHPLRVATLGTMLRRSIAIRPPAGRKAPVLATAVRHGQCTVPPSGLTGWNPMHRRRVARNGRPDGRHPFNRLLVPVALCEIEGGHANGIATGRVNSACCSVNDSGVPA